MSKQAGLMREMVCSKGDVILKKESDLLVKDTNLTTLFFHIFNCGECKKPAHFGLTLMALAVRGATDIALEEVAGQGYQEIVNEEAGEAGAARS